MRMRVLYSYSGGEKHHIKVQEGEIVTIKEADKCSEWPLIKDAKGNRGYIPRTFLCEYADSPEEQSAFMVVDRREAERLLMLPGGVIGMFLIRPTAETAKWTLSVLMPCETSTSAHSRSSPTCVNHLEIKRLENKFWCGRASSASCQVMMFISTKYSIRIHF